ARERGPRAPRPRRYRRHLGLRHLALAGFSAQLQARLVQVSEAVQATGRELTAARRERQLAGQADALAALDERAALTLAAELQTLEPVQGEHGEAVVELGAVDVGRLEIRARPQMLACAHRGGGGHVPPL